MCGTVCGEEISQTLFLLALFIIFFCFAIMPSRRKEVRRRLAIQTMDLSRGGARVLLSSGILAEVIRELKSDSDDEKKYLIKITNDTIIVADESSIAKVFV